MLSIQQEKFKSIQPYSIIELTLQKKKKNLENKINDLEGASDAL